MKKCIYNLEKDRNITDI